VGERFVSARPSQYDAEHGQTDSSAAFSKSRDPPGGHSPGRAGSVTSPPPTPAGRGAFRRPPRSRRRNPPRSLPRPGSVTSPPHEPTPAGRGASRHRRPPHSSMRSAIPLMSDTLRRRHLTRRRSASRPEAAGSSAARSSRQGDQKRRSAWCGISRGREKTLFRRYL